MTEPNWPRHGLRLGVVGVRRTFRRLRRNPYRFRIASFAAVCLGISFGGMGVLYALLLRTYTGPIAVSGGVRVGVSLIWVGGVWFFAQQALLHWRTPKAKQFVLTTVSTRTVAFGMLLTEFLSACLLLAPPAALLVGIVGYAFLSPGTLVLVPLAVALFAASAVVVGYAAGFASLFVSAGSRGLSKRRSHLIIQLVLLVVIGYLFFADGPVIPEGVTVSWLPMSWLVDLAVLGTPVEASVGRALAGVATCLALIGGAGVLTDRLAGRYWTTDPTSTKNKPRDGQTSGSIRGSDALANAISPVVIPEILGRPTQRVAQLVVLRLRRAPRRLLLLLTMVVSVGIYVATLLGQVENPLAVVPVVCAVFVPWLVGAAFGLNPLGDEGVVLPMTLASSISGREFAWGLMIPGLLYGLPVVVVSTFFGSVVSPYAVSIQAGLIVSSAVLTVVAVGIAPAIGMRFPRFSAVSIGQSIGVVPPSIIALLIYSGGIVILGGGVVFTLIAPASIYQLFTPDIISVEALRAGSVACGLGIGLLVVKWGYNTTAQQFQTYTVS